MQELSISMTPKRQGTPNQKNTNKPRQRNHKLQKIHRNQQAISAQLKKWKQDNHALENFNQIKSNNK